MISPLWTRKNSSSFLCSCHLNSPSNNARLTTWSFTLAISTGCQGRFAISWIFWVREVIGLGYVFPKAKSRKNPETDR